MDGSLVPTRPPQAEGAPAGVTTELPPLRVAFAVLTLALMPFPLILHGWGNPKLTYDYLTIIFPVDLAFAGLLATGVPATITRLRRRQAGPGTLLWTALAAVLTLALLAHPSGRGLHTIFEVWGVAVLASTIDEIWSEQTGAIVLGTVAIVAIVETAWATAQLVTGSSIGLTGLGEDSKPLLPFPNGAKAPMGSMVHPYVLAGLALVVGAVLVGRAITAPRPWPWLATAAVAAVPIGFTFSRAGLLGFALLVGCLALAAVLRRPLAGRYAAAALALCIGAGVPAAIWSAGWRDRATQTTTATSAAVFTTDRGHLAHEALAQLGAHPLTGVGPGRYVESLKERYGTESDRYTGVFKPVHNLPLLVGAEGGIFALLLGVILFAALGWHALRAGPIPLALYLAYLPFAMLDHFAYSFPQGLVITAVWLAGLDHLCRRGDGRAPAWRARSLA
jgi:hypothetical protein